MNKKLSMRMLAGFLAFIMVFFSVSDYSVFAADTATDVVAEVDADDADSAADVESNDSVDVTVDDGDTATVTETVSANNTDDSNIVVDEEEVKPVKEIPGLSYSNNEWKVAYRNGDKDEYRTYATLASGVLTFKKIDEDIALEVPGDMFSISGTDGVAEKVTSVVFESGCKISLITINAFNKCKNLTSVDVSKSTYLKTIDEGAFKGCSKLTSVKFPNTLAEIKTGAFSGCNLSEVTITENVVEIGKNAFENNSNLKSVIYCAKSLVDRDFDRNPDNIFYGCSINKIEFLNKDLNVWPAYLFSGATFETNHKLVIPAQFHTIGRAAFACAQNITEVSFEKKDGEYKVATFEQAAFFGLQELVTFEIPSSLKSIKWQCFEGCTSITEMDIAGKASDVNLIGKWAFAACTSLSKVTIPSGVVPKYDLSGTVMDEYDSSIEAFRQCTALKTINIEFSEVCPGEFMESGLETVTFGPGTKKIHKQAFQDVKGLTSINTNKVTYIGEYAFKNCENLASLKMSDNVSKIDKFAFDNCGKLASIASDTPSEYSNVLPKALTYIGEHAFYDCDSLEETVILPSKLEYIGDYAFSCQPTKKIDEVDVSRNMKFRTITIPENVKFIGEGAFYNNTGLYSVIIKSKLLGTSDYGSCGKNIFSKALISELVLPTGIEKIPNKLFCGAGFKPGYKMTIPASVKEIGEYAFAASDNENEAASNAMAIAEYVFESGTQLETIGQYAFYYNVNLTKFDIPNTVKSIGQFAFAYCNHLEKIVIPENVEELGAYAFYCCSEASVIEYNAIAVTTCGNNIFGKCNIKSVIIGPNVKIIPEGLFMDANFVKDGEGDNFQLIDIVIPAEVTEISRNAFNNFKNLGTVSFESPDTLVAINEAAFNGCENLKSINIPDSVTKIEASAFTDCSKLSKLNMPKSLEVLGDNAFKGCKNLSEIIIPEKLETIGISTFEGCEGATKITYLGNRVKEIKDNAFAGCKGLIGLLNVNHGVEIIGSLAFANCTGATALQLPTSIQNEEDIADNAFLGCKFTKFYAVKDSAAYKWLVKMGYLTGSNFEAMKTITYVDVREGDFNPNPGGYHIGETVVFKPLEREGYKFIGFYEDEAFTKEIKSTEGKTDDLKIYLKWEAQIFKVTYDMDGTGVNNVNNPLTVPYGDDLKLYAPVYRGFGFSRWVLVETNENGEEFESDIEAVTKEDGSVDYQVVRAVKKDITVRAKWEEINYQIKFNLNDEKASFRNDKDGNAFPEALNVNGGAEVSLYSENQVKCAGSALMGWNTQADGKGTHYEPGEYVTGLATARDQVIELYAEWESGCYYIKYSIGKGATVSDNVLYTKVPASSTKQKKLLEAKYVNKPGYTLVGWSTKKNGKGDVYKPGEMMNPLKEAGKTATLYAIYTINTYGIRYILPEGAVNSPKNRTEYTVAKTISLKKPSLPGYVFVGWYKSYDPENGYKQKVTKLSKGKQTGNLTLYARFQTSITYNANGGKLTAAGKTLLKKSAKTEYDPSGMITLAAPAVTEMYKSGLNFAGWSTTKDGVTGAFYEVGKAYPYKDIVNACGGKKIKLYAQWR